jgi:hypothetical protein
MYGFMQGLGQGLSKIIDWEMLLWDHVCTRGLADPPSS